jgi:hypothetical protein
MRTLHPTSTPSVTTQHWGHPIFTEAFVVSFWRKIDRRDDNECWPWLASTGGSQYGHCWTQIDGKKTCRDAHWVAWVIANGRLPAGNVTHDCNSKPCCNPAHLADRTQSVNISAAYRDGLLYKVLTPGAVKALIRDSAEKPVIELAGRYGVSARHIRSIRAGEFWGHTTGRQFQPRARPAQSEQLKLFERSTAA